MTEQEARAGGEIVIGALGLRTWTGSRTTAQSDGFAKVIADAKTGVLIGAHFVCARLAAPDTRFSWDDGAPGC